MKIHVIPVDDVMNEEPFSHVSACHCDCFPMLEVVGGDKDGKPYIMFIHNAFDLREKWERQNLKTKGWISIEENEPPTTL